MISRRRMLAGANLTSKGVVDGVIQDDWDQIIKICKSGKADQFYSEGDYKPLEVSGIGTFNMLLTGFKDDIRTDAREFSETTWVSREAFNSLQLPQDGNTFLKSFQPLSMNESQFLFSVEWTNNYLDTVFLALFPVVVQSNIVPVEKSIIYSYSKTLRGCNLIRSNKVWIPGFQEYKYLGEHARSVSSGDGGSYIFANYGKDIERHSYFDSLEKTKAFKVEDPSVASESLALRDVISSTDSDGHMKYSFIRSLNSSLIYGPPQEASANKTYRFRFGFCF